MTTTTKGAMDSILDALTQWREAEAAGNDGRLTDLVPTQARVRGPRRRDAAPAAETAAAPAAPVARVIVKRPNGQDYVARAMEGGLDVEQIRKAREARVPVLLYGDPGTGKTALLEAALHDQPGGLFWIAGSADTEVADFIGSYVQSPGGSFSWVDGPLVRAMETGGTLLVDEIALIDSKVLSVLYSIMDGRDELVITANPERGTVKAAPGFYVVGACNPNVPGARMSEALISRFTFQAEFHTDYDLAKSLGVPSKMVTAAKNLGIKKSNGEVSWAPQMRELLAFRDMRAVFGDTLALRNMVAVAPEIDRAVVADMLSRTYGTEVKALVID